MKASPLPPTTPTTPEAPVETNQRTTNEPSAATIPTDRKPLAWPEWFAGLDVVLGIITLLLAFLVASFVARNSDIWLHLAGGRLIASGELFLGSDPFSLAGDERPWIHTHWLYDLGVYALYQMDTTGVILVGVKAALFSVAFLLLGFLRRPGYAFLPWAFLGTLGVLAAAPYTVLRPPVVSILLFSATIVLLDRLDWKRPGWRTPLILASLFALWANLDGWFFLGPLYVLGLFLGNLLQSVLTRSQSSSSEQEGPFLRTVPTAAAAKALLVGSIACLLNPFFLAAFTKNPTEAIQQLLPIELGFGLPLGSDQDITLATLGLKPLSSEYLEKTYLGNSVNGVAFGLLIVLGIVVMLAGFARLRATHIVLWLIFLGLAFVQVRFIPFFALVAIPLVASHWNQLASYIRLGGANRSNDRVILTLSGFSRVLFIIIASGLLLLTYPGWLHPQVPNRSTQNRLDWGIQADQGLERSARLLAKLRQNGTLPQEFRGLNTSLEFGNYCAWFAPTERVFVNTRYSFHRTELEDLITLGKTIPRRANNDELNATLNDITKVMKSKQADFLVAASTRTPDLPVIFSLWARENEYELWHLDGRCAVLGFYNDDASKNERIRALRFSAAQLAFEPGQPPLPDGKSLPPLLPKEEFFDRYFDRPALIPADADDAQVYARFEDLLNRKSQYFAQQAEEQTRSARGAFGGIATVLQLPIAQEFNADLLALPILQLRAARRSLAANPDYLDSWTALEQAYTSPLAPITLPEEAELQLLTARVQLLDRLPSPDRANVFQAQYAFQVCEKLLQTFLTGQQLDAAKKYLDLYDRYYSMLPNELKTQIVAQRLQGQSGINTKEDALKAFTEAIEQRQDAIRREVNKKNEAIDRQAGPIEKFQAALQLGMPLRAVKIANELTESELTRWPQELKILRLQVALQLGQIDEVSATLEANKEELEKLLSQPSDDPGASALRQLQSLRYRLEGNYTELLKILPKPTFPKVNYDPTVNRLPAVYSTLAAAGGATISPWFTAEAEINQALANTALTKHLAELTQAREVLLSESLYAYDRAMIALIAGQIEDAQIWLNNAAKPQGVTLEQLGDIERNARIAKYLESIDQAAAATRSQSE